MTLAAFQDALVRLVSEPVERERFARAANEWARGRGLDARSLDLLLSVPRADLEYFGAIVARDRAFDHGSLFPLTLALAGEALALHAYVRALPYPEPRAEREGARFAAFIAARAPPGARGLACVDLARFEAAKLAMRAEDAAKRAPSGTFALAPGHRVLPVRSNLAEVADALANGRTSAPRAEAGAVLLARQPGGRAVGIALQRGEAAVLAALDRPRALDALLARALRESGLARWEAEVALGELVAEGVVMPPATP